MELLSPKLSPWAFLFWKRNDFQVESGAAVQLSELWERRLIVIYNDPWFFSKQQNISTSSPRPRSASQARGGWILLWATSTTIIKISPIINGVSSDLPDSIIWSTRQLIVSITSPSNSSNGRCNLKISFRFFYCQNRSNSVAAFLQSPLF